MTIAGGHKGQFPVNFLGAGAEGQPRNDVTRDKTEPGMAQPTRKRLTRCNEVVTRV
jgi:hypothetical protein